MFLPLTNLSKLVTETTWRDVRQKLITVLVFVDDSKFLDVTIHFLISLDDLIYLFCKKMFWILLSGYKTTYTQLKKH